MSDDTRSLRFTKRERFLIEQALRIAVEDGSIYSAANAESDDQMSALDAELQAIEKKLGQPRRRRARSEQDKTQKDGESFLVRWERVIKSV